jgi:hypothetical protein
MFAGCGSAGTGQTTRQSFSASPEASARAGQLPVPAGRLPTRGSIGLNPTKADGVQLDVPSGLLDDTPIYNGDFADPFTLRMTNDLYAYALNTETDADEALVADGRLACAGLAHEQGADDVLDSLTRRGLSQFEAGLVGFDATEYLCPQDGLQALKDVQEALTQGSS